LIGDIWIVEFISSLACERPRPTYLVLFPCRARHRRGLFSTSIHPHARVLGMAWLPRECIALSISRYDSSDIRLSLYMISTTTTTIEKGIQTQDNSSPHHLRHSHYPAPPLLAWSLVAPPPHHSANRVIKLSRPYRPFASASRGRSHNRAGQGRAGQGR